MKGTTVRTRIFLYSIWSGFTNVPSFGTLAKGIWDLDREELGGFLRDARFCMK